MNAKVHTHEDEALLRGEEAPVVATDSLPVGAEASVEKQPDGPFPQIVSALFWALFGSKSKTGKTLFGVLVLGLLTVTQTGQLGYWKSPKPTNKKTKQSAALKRLVSENKGLKRQLTLLQARHDLSRKSNQEKATHIKALLTLQNDLLKLLRMKADRPSHKKHRVLPGHRQRSPSYLSLKARLGTLRAKLRHSKSVLSAAKFFKLKQKMKASAQNIIRLEREVDKITRQIDSKASKASVRELAERVDALYEQFRRLREQRQRLYPKVN